LFIERPPLRIGTPSPSSASGGRSHVLDRHAEGLSMPLLPRRRDDRQPTRACPPAGTPALTSAPPTHS